MKKIYLLAMLAITFMGANAQNFDWAKDEGLWAYDYGYGIVADNNSNIYVAGKYEMAANFSSTILPCEGNHDIYVAQYTNSGNLNWIRTAGGTLGDYAWGVACDNSNVYIAGEIEGLNEHIVFEGSTISLTCIGSNDIFVAKYDVSGNLLWAKSAGGYDYDKALGVTYDASGNVYICGIYETTATFGGTTTVTSVGDKDIFVAKYDANGNFLWVRNAGSTGRDEAKSIKCDASGNVYICGMYCNGCTFGTTTLTSVGNFDAYIAKYSPTGTLLWVKSAGDAWNDVAWSLTIDGANKIYVGGECTGYVPFGNNVYAITSGGYGSDAFVACYDAAGTAQWATNAGGQLDDRVRGIGLNGNYIFLTGQFGGTANFGSHTLVAADSSDIFFASISNTGIFMGSTSVGGTPDIYEDLGYESGIAICSDATGNAFATGALLDNGIFGSSTLTTYDRTDVFITKISLLTGVNDLANDPKKIIIYPNPSSGNFTIDLSQLGDQKKEMKITNCLGQVVASKTDISSINMVIDLSDQEKGIYFIEIMAEDRSISRGKIMIQ